MADDSICEHVFLDADVFVRFGFRYSSTLFKSLIDLVAKGRLKLVITDIVVREVEAQIEKAVRAASGAHKKFSKEARVLASATLDGVKSKVEKFDEDAAVANLRRTSADFSRTPGS